MGLQGVGVLALLKDREPVSPPVAIKLFAATAIVRGRLPNWVLPPSMPGRWLNRVIGRTLGLT